MQLPLPKDALHKAWLYRILSAFYDDPYLIKTLYFKGGTCAAMLGLLDRFSVDLDFDLIGNKNELIETQKTMERIFDELGLHIKDQSRRVPQYFLKYPAKDGEQNTIKIDVAFPPTKTNIYKARRFSEIDRIITCQTPETMFSNKLVALIDRYRQKRKIAGRDVYDVHYFFSIGLKYNEAIIKERTGQKSVEFFTDLIDFVENKVTDEFIAQDLNVLLPYNKFRVIRKTLKQETLIFLHDELERIKRSL